MRASGRGTPSAKFVSDAARVPHRRRGRRRHSSSFGIVCFGFCAYDTLTVTCCFSVPGCESGACEREGVPPTMNKIG